MTALTAARATKEREAFETGYAVDAGVKVIGGGMVAFGATGYARPAANATTSRCMGVAMETVDNTAGAAGAATVKVRRSCFSFATTDVTLADVGKDCWAVDDQTVTKTQPGSNPAKAGVIVAVDVSGSATQVWVDMAA
jgi:hypothetical protein